MQRLVVYISLVQLMHYFPLITLWWGWNYVCGNFRLCDRIFHEHLQIVKEDETWHISGQMTKSSSSSRI